MRIAGIGSRSTPPDVLAEMTKIGEHAASNGWVITSGHANGADYAFEIGSRLSCVVYLPWDGFNSRLPVLGRAVIIDRTDALDDLVRKFHPAPGRLTHNGWALMRRNACQVLGRDLDKPVDAVVCWTSDGKATGGTGQAIRIAESRNIPVINLFGGKSAQDIIAALDGITGRSSHGKDD